MNKLVALRLICWCTAMAVYASAGSALAQEKEQTPEDKAWALVDSLNKQSLEGFLKQFGGGTHAEEATLAVTLQERFDAIRSKKSKPELTIPFETLGARWASWQKRNPDKGVIGYFSKKRERSASLGWFSPLTGGKTPGCNTVSFDASGVMASPTGDGSIIAFRTDGLKYGFLGGIVIETPGDEPIFFGVLDGTGWVHLAGAGQVTLLDGKTVELKWPPNNRDVQYFYSSLASYTEPDSASNAGVITETFLAKANEDSSLDLQSIERVHQATGWPKVKEQRIHFGPRIKKGMALFAKVGTNTVTCEVEYQDVAYLTKNDQAKALRVLAFRGCPFKIGNLVVEKTIKLRKLNEIEIESAEGRILHPQRNSLVPFLATENSLQFLCWNTLNAQLKFLHAGTVLETEDAAYKVLKDGAHIWFSEEDGVTLDGIEKLPRK